MISYIIPLLSSYFSSGIANYFLFPFIALSFIAFVPVLVRKLFIWG